ncbi:hypothetical protein [Methylobacterium sp. Leaf112]|uniref:hypothetical protein n=1 Tax=Methylobacterium sp. Leaf112 TaxID=1736258 RepID=UPI0006FD18EA|nr:hypothetical protein [Methylobacterium sp. Leaf112]KQP62163.1 hypothetical protein ASF52_05760 [Methylobacterium sp. Leaf112]
MNSILATAGSYLTAAEPWKAVIASVLGFLAAGLSIVGGIVKQRRSSDTTVPDQAPSPRPTTFRLHADDRELIDNAREAAADLTRAIKHLTGATEDDTLATEGNTAALKRRGGRP